MQFASPTHGIGAYLQNGDLQDMIEEQIFVSQPVRTQQQQRQQTVRKQEFSQKSQLKFCLPAPGIFQNQRPPPLKIVNSVTLSGKKNKGVKGKRPFSAKSQLNNRVAKSALSWKSPPFIKSRPQTKQTIKSNKSAAKLVQWDSNVQQIKLFDDMKRNTLERQMILQQKRLAQSMKKSVANQFGGLTVNRNDIQSKTLIEFQGKNQGTHRKLQICHDGKLLNEASNTKSAAAMAIERRQILRQRQKRDKQLKQKQALLFKEKAALLGNSKIIERGGKKEIIIAKPTLAALQKDQIEIRKNEQIMETDDRKLEQLRAGIDLNLQKRDEMILDLRNQFEKLLQNRKSMNDQFVKKIQDMQKEKVKMRQTMLKKATGKQEKKDKDQIPTRDPGFSQKKGVVNKKKKINSTTLQTTPQKKKLVSAVQKRPNPNQLLTQAMIKHQIDRQVQLDYQKKVTQKILLSMKQNPNSQLYLMQKEVDALTEKLAPVMERVQSTVSNMNELNYVRHKSNSIGMVSRMAGKFMAINADKIVDLLLDQLLQETVLELDNIEREMRQNLEEDESQQTAQQLLNLLGQFNDQADQVEQKLVCGQLTSQLKYRKQKRKKNNIQIEGISLTQQQGQVYQHPFNVRSKQETKKQNRQAYEEDQILKMSGSDKHRLQNIRYKDKQEVKYQVQGSGTFWKRGMKLSQLHDQNFKSIQNGMLRYSQYVIRANGSDNQQVWKLYDHICDDLFAQIFGQAVKAAQVDIESAFEGMIAEEILGTRK